MFNMFNSRQLVILTAVTFALAQNFEWDCTNSLATCNNACFAINCKGAPGTLNYDINPANRGPRRTASGCNRTPCTNTNYGVFGNSCDEFPFASTYQGGAGAILRCVDSSENSSEGGQLGNFYKFKPDGYQFGLFVRNYGGATYCDYPTYCVNDGGEFRLVGGGFVNARRSDDQNVLFVPADSTTVGTPFRKFMGSDGVERLWLTKNTTGSPIGEDVWDGVGEKVQIIREIFSS